MCRLLGIKNFTFSEHKELLASFAKLAETGKTLQGDPPGHTDGWGLAWYEEGQARIYKSAGSLLKEEQEYLFTLEQASKSPVLIAHLRKSAWPETTTVENAHPFMHDNCVFAHNGTVRDYKTLLPRIALSGLPLDTALDTEILFYYILSIRSDGMENAFRSAVDDITQHHQFSSLNSLLSDGEKLYACREYSNYPEYYTLYRARSGAADIIASEPLSPSLNWELMKKGELLAL